MATSRTIYKYHFKLGNRIVHTGITRDIDRREAEHRQKLGWRRGHIVQIGRRTTEKPRCNGKRNSDDRASRQGHNTRGLDMDNPITLGEILLEEYLKPMGFRRMPWPVPSVSPHGQSTKSFMLDVRSPLRCPSALACSSVSPTNFGTDSKVECDFRKLAREEKMLTTPIPASKKQR